MEVEKRIRGYDRDMADEIISRMHSFETDLGRFVDREGEAREILGQGWGRVVEGGRITVLYGPKGCGKSTLFGALRYSLAMLEREGFESGYDLVYVVTKPEEPWEVSGAYSSMDLWELVVEAVSSLGGSLDQSGVVKGLVDADKFIAILVGRIVRRFEKADLLPALREPSPNYSTYIKAYKHIAIPALKDEAFSCKKILIALDEARASSRESLGDFRGWLEAYANMVAEYNRDYSRRGGSIAVIALTSDALVREIRHVVSGKVNWAVIWNLSRRASEELISQIGLHHRVARELGINSEESRELLWRLAGGNPRALRMIWEKGLRRWLVGEVIDGIQGFVQDLPIEARGKALERISASLDKVDDIGWTGPEIWKAMMRHNIIIYIAAADKISEIPSEPWIGRRFAFQIPAYYHALKAIARKKSWEISPEEVIRESRG